MLKNLKQLILSIVFLAISVPFLFRATGLAAAAEDTAVSHECSPDKVNEVLGHGSAQNTDVFVACNLKLRPGDKVTKNILITGASASNISVECNGATIYKASIHVFTEKRGNEWLIPKNVTISQCTIDGGDVRVYGVAVNGQGTSYGNAFHDSSRSSTTGDGTDHTQRAQANAPDHIHFDRMKIEGGGIIPVYLSPGVTDVFLTNSEIGGYSNSVAIYLDAESAHNIIKHNYIHTKTGGGRELVAIDGSADNTIEGNYFSSLSHGGIYIYRNCGEGGTIRVQAPTGNKIVNNIFFYNKYKGDNPAVWVGSRKGNSYYCNADSGFNYGSSANDGDFAKDTIVKGNQVVRRAVAEMLRFDDQPNYVSGNSEVTEETADRRQK